jgi:hypothetical protein
MVSSGGGNSWPDDGGPFKDGFKLLENACRTVLMKKTPEELPTNWLSSLPCAVREPISSEALAMKSEDSILAA